MKKLLLISLLLTGFMASTFAQTIVGTDPENKNVVLEVGSNAITVIVTNNCGTNKSNFTLNYVLPETPCSAPELTAGSPLTLLTEEETVIINAVVSNVLFMVRFLSVSC